jgi:hypothetical protein
MDLLEASGGHLSPSWLIAGADFMLQMGCA